MTLKIFSALANFPSASDKPTAIIAHTVKGKVSLLWKMTTKHYRIPAEDDAKSKIELGF